MGGNPLPFPKIIPLCLNSWDFSWGYEYQESLNLGPTPLTPDEATGWPFFFLQSLGSLGWLGFLRWMCSVCQVDDLLTELSEEYSASTWPPAIFDYQWEKSVWWRYSPSFMKTGFWWIFDHGLYGLALNETWRVGQAEYFVGWPKRAEQLFKVPPDSSQLLDFCRTPGQEHRAQEPTLTVSRVVRSGKFTVVLFGCPTILGSSSVWVFFVPAVLEDHTHQNTTWIHVILPDLEVWKLPKSFLNGSWGSWPLGAQSIAGFGNDLKADNSEIRPAPKWEHWMPQWTISGAGLSGAPRCCGVQCGDLCFLMFYVWNKTSKV